MTIASSVDSLEKLERVEAQDVCPEKALADLLRRGSSQSPHVHTH